MSVSFNWLKEYVDIDWTPEELAHRLTMAGIAIEGVAKIDEDVVLELDLTPNRGDCMGLLNLAREVSALNGKPLRLPAIKLKENQENIKDYINVKIAAPDLCRRYAARLVKNVQIKPSPVWMQEALLHAGIRPINNIVDITNYVMLETNQPLHAFDYDLLGNEPREIHVRTAMKNETFTTLDGVKRQLDEQMLVITDGECPVALAGVMGGENSEINDGTVNVMLESANFEPVSIRKTSRKLGLRSDSSIRFEKGVDPNGVIFAIDRAAGLIQELGGGQVVKGVFDVYPQPGEFREIVLRPDKVNTILGTSITTAQIKEYMLRLGFGVKEKKKQLLVTVPSYRPDIEIEVDLIEEVARLYGYNSIPDDLPSGHTTQGGFNSFQKFRQQVKDTAAKTMYEVVNYSFINPQYFDWLMLPADSLLRKVVKIANPLSEDYSVMRTLLLPGLLLNISRNLAKKNDSLAFFELGSVFYPTAAMLPEEKLKLGVVVAGSSEHNWLKRQTKMDFFFLKGILENILRQLGVPECEYLPVQVSGYHPGRTAMVRCQDQEVGVIGEIHPRVLDQFEIKTSVCAFEVDIETLYQMAGQKKMRENITRYPSIERDIALILPVQIVAAQVDKVIRSIDSPLLREVTVFDLYTGEQVPAGKKSMAFRLVFRSDERTLKDQDINPLMDSILENLQDKVQASLR